MITIHCCFFPNESVIWSVSQLPVSQLIIHLPRGAIVECLSITEAHNHPDSLCVCAACKGRGRGMSNTRHGTTAAQSSQTLELTLTTLSLLQPHASFKHSKGNITLRMQERQPCVLYYSSGLFSFSSFYFTVSSELELICCYLHIIRNSEVLLLSFLLHIFTLFLILPRCLLK